MPAPKSKRRSRKRHSPGSAPRAVASTRRELRAERSETASRAERVASRQLGTLGERPASPFGGLPVSEIAIFAGIVGLLVWFFAARSTVTLIVSLAVCCLGVLEVTLREHLSGFRSHTMLLAAIPSLGLAIGVLSITGADRRNRAPLLIAIAAPVFGLLVLLLKRRFQAARHARAVRAQR